MARIVIKSADGFAVSTRLNPQERKYSDAVTPVAIAFSSMVVFSSSKRYTLIDLVRFMELRTIPCFTAGLSGIVRDCTEGLGDNRKFDNSVWSQLQTISLLFLV